MKIMEFTEAADSALGQEMAQNKDIILLGEDVHTLHVNLFARFGKNRVKHTPISESAFLGASVTAAMAGLRPVVEIMLVDFIGVAMDGLLNHASKIHFFSGGKWNVPMVIRTTCGGGYGDGGQHEQSLWGWLAHIPGISVVVPSNPADAGGLMLTALRSDHPVVFMEHKLLSKMWLDYMGVGGRDTVKFDVPPEGNKGEVPDRWEPIPIGKVNIIREGNDITIVSLGVGVHQAMKAAKILSTEDIEVEVVDLRAVSPLDVNSIAESVGHTGRLLVVDEDYKMFGLSGEISAALLEKELKFKYRRVCTDTIIPFSHKMEVETLPSVKKIVEMCFSLMKK